MANDQGSERTAASDNPAICNQKALRNKGKIESPENLGENLVKTVRHFFGDLNDCIKALPEPRNKEKIIYTPEHLFWCGILMFLLHLESRNQFKHERDTPVFLKNILRLSQSNEKTVAHPDTLAYYFEKQLNENLNSFPAHIVKTLIRNKVLDQFRLGIYFLVAFDGTGQHTFKDRHCEK